MLLAGAANAGLGGFGVSVYLPTPNDPQTKDALLMVQPIGCHGPGASVAARAEGMVNGVRKSIPLKLTAVPGVEDTYMVRREWPSEGAWVLLFTAKKETMRVDSLVRLGSNGMVRVIARPRGQNWDSATVLPDGKTKLLPWSFRDEPKVVAMDLVWGDLNKAIDYVLKANSAQR